MANLVEVILSLRGSRQFQSEAKKSSDAVEGIGKSADTAGKKAGTGWKGVAKWAGGAAIFAGASAYVGKAVSAATDLNEEINKTGVVFRDASPQLVKWSKGAATSMGMAQQEALAAMGTFGNMLVPMGIARGDAATMSKTMVQLASDMASFNNASPADTLDAVRAGLAGESEPLRKYGVFLNDARLKQQAMSMGLYSGKGNLDANAKALATYQLILKDTKDAQGDFQRTSGGLANKQRILKAQFTDQAAAIGSQLLPVALTLATALGFLLKNTWLLYPVIGLLTAAFIALKVAEIAATLATMTLNASVLLIPLAIAAVVAGIVILYLKWKWFHNAVNNTWNWIKSHWPLLVSILLGPISIVTVLIIKNFGKIKDAAKSVWGTIKSTFSKITGFLKQVFSVDFVKGIGRGIADWLNAHTPFGDTIDLGIKKIHIPALAAGGTMIRAGAALVGEQGPELVSLPRGASVYPTPVVEALGARPSLEAGGGGQTVVTKVYLDKRQIAEAVGTYAADQRARR